MYCGANDAPVELLDNLSMAGNSQPIPHPEVACLYVDEKATLRARVLALERELKMYRDWYSETSDKNSVCYDPKHARLQEQLAALAASLQAMQAERDEAIFNATMSRLLTECEQRQAADLSAQLLAQSARLRACEERLQTAVGALAD